LATLLLVTIFIETACIFLATSRVPQYQAFHIAFTFLLDVQSFTDKKLTTTQDHQTPQRGRTPISIVILILRSKKYYRVVTLLIRF